MKRRIWAAACALALALALFPQVALADPDEGRLEIGDVCLCEEYNTPNPVVHPYTDSSAVYDLASNTLTLTNFNGGGVWAYKMGDDFTIVLVGRNVLQGYNSQLREPMEGLYIEHDDAKITGGAGSTLECNGIWALYESTLVIDGSARVTVLGNPSTGDDWIAGTWVTALRLLGNCVLTTTGGYHRVNTGIENASYGLATTNLSVSGNAALTARGGLMSTGGRDFSIGIRTNRMEVTSGTVLAYGGSANTESGGVFCYDDSSGPNVIPGSITVSGGRLMATGRSYGLSLAPDLSRYVRYRWKTDANAANYTDSDQTAYRWSNAQTYAEIAPLSAPVITSPTTDKTVPATVGSPATFSVIATGATGYQWWANRGSGFVQIPDATRSSYVTAPVTLANNGYQYYCVVTDASGSVTSPIFTLNATETSAVPATGDGATPVLWLCTLLIAGAVMTGRFLPARRKRRN